MHETNLELESREIYHGMQAIAAVERLEDDEFLDDYCELIDSHLRLKREHHPFSLDQIKQLALTEAFLLTAELDDTPEETPYELIAERVAGTLAESADMARDYMRDPAPTIVRNVYKYNIPKKREQQELVHAAQDGDKEAEAAVVGSCLRFIHSKHIKDRVNGATARSRRVRGITDVDDNAQEAAAGLLRALAKFSGDEGTTFLTYADHWMRQRVTRAQEFAASTIRIPGGVQGKMREAWAIADLESGPNVASDDITKLAIKSLDASERLLGDGAFSSEDSYWQWVFAARTNLMDAGAVRIELDEIMDYASSSESYLVEADDGSTIELDDHHWITSGLASGISSDSQHDDYDLAFIDPVEEFATIGEIPEELPNDTVIDNLRLSKLIAEIKSPESGLSLREKFIIAWRFGFVGEGEPPTLEAIGEKLDLTRERVRQIERRALGLLRYDTVKKYDFEPIERPENIWERDRLDKIDDGPSSSKQTTEEYRLEQLEKYEAATIASIETAQEVTNSFGTRRLLQELTERYDDETFKTFSDSLLEFGARGSLEILIATLRKNSEAKDKAKAVDPLTSTALSRIPDIKDDVREFNMYLAEQRARTQGFEDLLEKIHQLEDAPSERIKAALGMVALKMREPHKDTIKSIKDATRKLTA